MRLRELFTRDVVKLDLESDTKADLLKELVALLALDTKSEGILFKTLKRRENLGSTGIGNTTNKLDTQVAVLDAESPTGSLILDNAGAVAIKVAMMKPMTANLRPHARLCNCPGRRHKRALHIGAEFEPCRSNHKFFCSLS